MTEMDAYSAKTTGHARFSCFRETLSGERPRVRKSNAALWGAGSPAVRLEKVLKRPPVNHFYTVSAELRAAGESVTVNYVSRGAGHPAAHGAAFMA